MSQSNGNYVDFENLGKGERLARVAVSVAAIVVAMESAIAGTALFAVICILAIALVMTGIIGWDPVRAMSAKAHDKKHIFPHHVDSTGHHV